MNTTTTTTKCRPSLSSATSCTRQPHQNTTTTNNDNNNKGKESGDDRRKRIWWSESNSKPSSSSRHRTDDEKKVVTPCCPGPNKKEQERSQQNHQTDQILQQQQQQKQKIDSLGDTDDNATGNGDFEWDIVQEDNEDDATEQSLHVHSAAQYIGLDTSLLMLKQMWTHDSFWGIFGVGQGATLGSLLALLGTHEFLSPPAFCIFVNGESVLDTDTSLPAAQPSKKYVEEKEEEKEIEYDEQQLLVDDLPCLHIIGTNESRPSSFGTTRLLQQFGGTAHYYNNNSTNNKKEANPLVMKSTINAMGRFIITQKKKLKSLTQKQKTLVTLRKLVQQQEQEAALLIADTIAANPPRGLQALILPGGKMGGYNAGIGDDGGMLRKPNPAQGTRGAPCPSDFMLPTWKRTQEVTTTNLWGKETTKNEWYTYCQCTIEKPILQRHLEQLRQQRQQHKKKQKETTAGEGRRGTITTEVVGPTPATRIAKEEVLLIHQEQQQQQQVWITNQNQVDTTNTNMNTNKKNKNKNNPKTKTNNFDLLLPESFGCCRLAPPSST